MRKIFIASAVLFTSLVWQGCLKDKLTQTYSILEPIYKSKDGQNYLVFHEDDPVSTDGQNRWQKGIDDWQNTEHKDDKMYHPPDDLLNFNKDTPTPTGNVQGAEATPTDSPTPTP